MPDTKTCMTQKIQKVGSSMTLKETATTSTSSDLMAEIDELRAKMDKDRESDKWLALAQAGMSL